MTNYYEEEDDSIFQRIVERKKKANAVKAWTEDEDEEVFRRILEQEDEKPTDELDPLVLKQQQMQEEADQMLKSIAKHKAAAAHSAVVLRIMSTESDDLDNLGYPTIPRVLGIEYHYDRINLMANETVLRSFIPAKNDMIIECYFEESNKVRLKKAETIHLREVMRSME